MTFESQMKFTFRAFAEDTPGETWQEEFSGRWPAYKRWFLRFGDRERPTYLESIRALKRYVPEFIPAYEEMVELAGGGDLAARKRYTSRKNRCWCATPTTRPIFTTAW